MFRTIFTTAGVLGASSLLLLDSAVKGTALLLLAGVAATALRRDSAATRHLVWLLAMVAMLIVPVVSATMPQWRVLPEWAGFSQKPVVVETSRSSIAIPTGGPVVSRQIAEPVEIERPRAATYQPAVELPNSRPAPLTPRIIPESAAQSWTGLLSSVLINALPLVWALGFSVLILRLLAARWMLWNCERQATVVWPSRKPANATHDAIAMAHEAACLQLEIGRPVKLLIHPDKTIPVVWGVRRCCVLLPTTAQYWGGEQLRSVLLHELAHIKRRDTITQLLTQIACALHWFNPLVWLAAWRLSVERERACDDLVLASGVRPSAYAGHLLEVVTGHSPVRWAPSCGLAMARKSSLEGRLVAVLNDNLNRRGVSMVLAAIALAIAVGVAVPIAMLRAAEKQAGEQPQPATTDMKQKKGAKLKLVTEQKLEWSEPAGGLRMAVAWPPVLGEPAAGDTPDLHLAVQNVSEAPVRLCTTAEASMQRRLTHKSKGTIQFAIVDDKPAGIDCTLEPREVVFLRLFAPDDKPGAAPVGAEIASGLRRMPDYSLVAEMDVSKAPAGAWTGKLSTPDSRVGVGADAPKNRKAQELFKVWLQHTRVNGKIPGGLVARVGERVQEFVKANATDKAGAPYAKRMAPLVPRLDGTRDWQPAEAATLLGDIAAVSDAPLSVALEEIAAGKIQHGLRLDKELESAPWGEPLSNGLRTACIIGPGVTSRLHYVDWVGNVVTRGGASPDKADEASAAVATGTQIRLGTTLGCRILIHNAGKEPVVFRTRAWHHIEPTAKDTKGAEIVMESVDRYTRAPLLTFRLEPGRYIELSSPGFGLGKYGFHDFGSSDIASWIGAKAGDEVTLTPGPLPLNDWNESPAPAGEPRWWLDFIIARLSLATPLPADAAERSALLRQAMADLFLQNVSPTDEETAAFLKDTSPQTLTNLAERIFHRPGVHAWAGPLQSGPTKFRVTAADPPGAKRPAAPAATPPPATPADAPKTGGESSAQVALPKHEDARALYQTWRTAARTDGKIPGALIGLLGESVKTFIKNNPTWKTTPQLEKMLSRFDASHDWSAQEAAALLDELAAVQATPVSMADGLGILGTGEPLPPHLADAPWGKALAGGLRLAYLLEPRTDEHPLGTRLQGRLLIHNSGKQPVVFRMWSWYQAGHKATDAKGADINIVSTEWLTLSALEPYRLAPGEFIEIDTAGIGVGADRNVEDWQSIRVGSWVEAKVGDEVTVTTEPVPLNDWNEKTGDEPQWWLDHITARLSRHLPLAADAENRKLIVYRVAMELFGTPVSEEISSAFVSDFKPDALDSLAKRLFHRPGLSAWAGPLTSAPTKFRVLPADPDVAKRTRVASNPGWYTLGELARLNVSRRSVGERIVNEASILFFSSDPNADAPGEPVPVELPDGYNTWAAALAPGTTVMWVAQKGLLRKIDFSKPEKVEVVRYEADSAASAPIPADIREALRAALSVPEAAK